MPDPQPSATPPADDRPSPRLEAGLAALGAALLTALAVPGLATWRGTPAFHDLASHHLPWRVWTARTWLSGQLPLWNPEAGCGFPMLAEPQVGALYPPNLLFGLIDPFAALNVHVLLHLWWAALGAYLLGRVMGLGRPGAALTGVVFGASGFLLTHVTYLPMLQAAAWLPWLLAAVDHFLLHGRPRAALGAAGAAGMVVLAGHPQVALLGALFAATYLVARVAAGYPDGPARRLRLSRGWRLSLALGFAGLLVLPQLAASLELAAQSERAGGVDAAFAARGSLPPEELLNAVVPRAFGYERPADIPLAHHHHGDGYWGRGESFWEDCFFVGVGPLLLALLAVVAGARGVRFHAAWAVVALLLMLGPLTPLFHLWRLLPGADLLRFPVRFSLLWTVSLAVLAGGGLEAWLAVARAGGRRYVWTTRVVAGLIVAAWLGALGAHLAVRSEERVVGRLDAYYDGKLEAWRALAADPPPGVDPALIPPPPVGGEAPITVATTYAGDDYYGDKARRIAAHLRWVTRPWGLPVALPLGMAAGVLVAVLLALRWPAVRWALPALAAVELLAFGSGFNPAVPWDEARAEPALLDALRAEADARDDPPLRVATVDRLRPLGEAAELVGASENLRHGIAEATMPSPLRVDAQVALVEEAGLGLELLPPEARLQRVAARADVVRALGVTHLQSVHPLPAPYEKVAGVLAGDASVRLYRVPRPWPRAGWVRELPVAAEGETLPLGGRALPRPLDQPGAIDVDLSAAGTGWVVITETAYPGWVVEVDGEPVEPAAAAGALLAVPVEAGASRLQCRYRPRTLLGSLAAFPLLWLLWLIWFAMSGVRRGRRRSP